MVEYMELIGDDYSFGIGFGDGGSGRPDFQLLRAGDGRLAEPFRTVVSGADDADLQ